MSAQQFAGMPGGGGGGGGGGRRRYEARHAGGKALITKTFRKLALKSNIPA
jgi:hypothetical protein